MKRAVLIFGIVAGIIISLSMVFMVNMFYDNPDIEPNDFMGYAIMVIVFALIFVGVRNYRNKELGGYISFGKALAAGALIALLASTIYVITWLVYYYNFVPDFMDRYIVIALKNCNPDQLPEKKVELERMKELYKNPLFVVLFTYMEILPVGLVVSLLSALLLKRKASNEQVK